MVAEYVDVSLDQLQFYSYTHLGTNFNSWRKNLRIMEAKKMMEEDPLRKMVSIRKSVGIEDKTNFRNAFFSVTGMHPGDYRRLIQRKALDKSRWGKIRIVWEQIRVILKEL